jgi:hypothetical protein
MNVAYFCKNFYNEQRAKNLTLQLSIEDINEAYEVVSNLDGFNIKYEPIKI